MCMPMFKKILYCLPHGKNLAGHYWAPGGNWPPRPALQAGQNNLRAGILPPGDPLAAAGSMIILRT